MSSQKYIFSPLWRLNNFKIPIQTVKPIFLIKLDWRLSPTLPSLSHSSMGKYSSKETLFYLGLNSWKLMITDIRGVCLRQISPKRAKISRKKGKIFPQNRFMLSTIQLCVVPLRISKNISCTVYNIYLASHVLISMYVDICYFYPARLIPGPTPERSHFTVPGLTVTAGSPGQMSWLDTRGNTSGSNLSFAISASELLAGNDCVHFRFLQLSFHIKKK